MGFRRFKQRTSVKCPNSAMNVVSDFRKLPNSVVSAASEDSHCDTTLIIIFVSIDVEDMDVIHRIQKNIF
jgi:hypothetical protein